LPDDFNDSGVKVAFNKGSGNVFLVNEDYEVAMFNSVSGRLESFYTSPHDGEEGFFDDLKEVYPSMHREDQQWFRDIAKRLDEELPVEDDE
jgi:hypothetical protein